MLSDGYRFELSAFLTDRRAATRCLTRTGRAGTYRVMPQPALLIYLGPDPDRTRGAASTRGDGDLQNIEQSAPGFAGSDADHAKSALGERRDRQAQITTSRSTNLRGVLSTTNLA